MCRTSLMYLNDEELDLTPALTLKAGLLNAHLFKMVLLRRRYVSAVDRSPRIIRILMSMRTFHPIPPEYQKSCPNKEMGPCIEANMTQKSHRFAISLFWRLRKTISRYGQAGTPFPRLKSVLVIRTQHKPCNRFISPRIMILVGQVSSAQKKAIGWIFDSCLFWLKYVFSWRWIHCRSTAPRLNHTCTRPNDDGISKLYKSIYIWAGW